MFPFSLNSAPEILPSCCRSLYNTRQIVIFLSLISRFAWKEGPRTGIRQAGDEFAWQVVKIVWLVSPWNCPVSSYDASTWVTSRDTSPDFNVCEFYELGLLSCEVLKKKKFTFIPSSGETCPTLASGLRIEIKHKYYIPLHTNLLVIYIIRMKSRLAVTQVRV